MSSTADVTTPRPAASPTAAATDSTVRPQPMPAQQSAAPHPAAAAPAPAPVYAQQVAPPPQTHVPPAAAAKQHPGKPKRGPVSRFIRSVFSHLLFAGVAVAGVLGYIYHAPILRDVGNTVCADNALGRWMDKTPVLADKAPAAPAAAATATTAAAATAPNAAAAPALAATPATPAAPASAPPAPALAPAPTAAVPVVAATSEGAATTKPETTTAGATPATSSPPPKPADATPANAPSTSSRSEPAKSPTTTAALEPPTRAVGDSAATVATPPVVSTTPPAGSAEALRRGLADAREAYAAGKPEAVAAYGELARRFPDNPDLTGELGNILFQQGKKEEAGEQFYETGLRLIRARQEARAACLVDVLRQLAPVRARELERLTSGAACPSSTVR
ncbi:MAG: tetratricopeptide repeat protein [Hyphomicrobiaceae bacterium]